MSEGTGLKLEELRFQRAQSRANLKQVEQEMNSSNEKGSGSHSIVLFWPKTPPNIRGKPTKQQIAAPFFHMCLYLVSPTFGGWGWLFTMSRKWCARIQFSIFRNSKQTLCRDRSPRKCGGRKTKTGNGRAEQWNRKAPVQENRRCSRNEGNCMYWEEDKHLLWITSNSITSCPKAEPSRTDR